MDGKDPDRVAETAPGDAVHRFQTRVVVELAGFDDAVGNLACMWATVATGNGLAVLDGALDDGDVTAIRPVVDRGSGSDGERRFAAGEQATLALMGGDLRPESIECPRRTCAAQRAGQLPCDEEGEQLAGVHVGLDSRREVGRQAIVTVFTLYRESGALERLQISVDISNGPAMRVGESTEDHTAR